MLWFCFSCIEDAVRTESADSERIRAILNFVFSIIQSGRIPDLVLRKAILVYVEIGKRTW